MKYSTNANQILVSDGEGGLEWKDPPSNPIPTKEELEAHPTLKQAWDEYMIIRKLLGLR